ncbi:MAG TPA: asparaginase [Actinomycetota bacterium]|nr:asparaginase [Actinomycetota bacterium]
MTIRLIATGGTIASRSDPGTGAVRADAAPEDLVATVPGLAERGVETEEASRINGWSVGPSLMLDVARRVRAALDDPAVDGVIVTHGTDTIEETAFFLDVTTDAADTVLCTAAMRAGDEPGADGPRNLLNAARAATTRALRGFGALVCLNDELHAARWARKLDTFRPSAFASPDHGPLARVTPTRLELLAPRPARWTFDLPDALDAPVPVVHAYSGIERGILAAILDATGARGLVVEGTGLGNVPEGAFDDIEAARARDLPVVIATRVPAGGTGPVYGGRGGGVALDALGVMWARGLSAGKARLLLALLLTGGLSGDDLRERFDDAARTLS